MHSECLFYPAFLLAQLLHFWHLLHCQHVQSVNLFFRVANKPLGSLFHPDNFVFSQAGAGNNWAKLVSGSILNYLVCALIPENQLAKINDTG